VDEMRRPACEGSPVSEQKGPHEPHGYWTRHYMSWLECPGWTRQEADAADLAGRVSEIARNAWTAPGLPPALPPGIRLECRPLVFHALQQLFVPSFAEFTASLRTGEDIMKPQIPVMVTAGMTRGQWRITADEGQIAEGTVHDG
jgi:hypothetical protein